MDEKLRLWCRKCGLRRQYDRAELMARVGDPRMPSFIFEIARAEGCERIQRQGEPGYYSDQCAVVIVPLAAPWPPVAAAIEPSAR